MQVRQVGEAQIPPAPALDLAKRRNLSSEDGARDGAQLHNEGKGTGLQWQRFISFVYALPE